MNNKFVSRIFRVNRIQTKHGILAVMALAGGLFLAGCGEGGGGEGGEGSHNPGQNCQTAGCHAIGSGEHSFVYSGTVYQGGQGVAGVTVTITQGGTPFSLITDSLGNFYTSFGNPAAGYTASVTPHDGIHTMATTQSQGACNASGCHDSARRIFAN
ncbi:MAG: hypothetical protein OEW12_05480 [Deltaproteobacteria bacterium]|nr:hypothetical protein [Deltaproteobacteria bacterium]